MPIAFRVDQYAFKPWVQNLPTNKQGFTVPDGNIYVGVYSTGIVVWNPATSAFIRPLGNPIVPGNTPPVSALGFDYAGRMHTTNPGDCSSAGRVYRLLSTAYDRIVNTGICPFAITFADVEK